jgi:GNAT superfamily N-acetyltransferase
VEGAGLRWRGGAESERERRLDVPPPKGTPGRPGSDRTQVSGRVEIRPAVRADAALVLRFIRELAEYEQLADQVVATEEGLASTLFGDSPKAEVVFAMVDGVEVGFALFFPDYSTFLGRLGIYLEDLYVRPEQRSRGVGRALLRHLARVALERGGGRLEWSVLDWNEPALAFYRALGARPVEGWTVHRLAGEALARLAEEPAAQSGEATP